MSEAIKRAAPCQVCGSHRPAPITTDHHHVIPESWGGGKGSNLVTICNTLHHGTHALIDLYVELKRQPTYAEMRGRFGVLPSKGMRDLAAQAWAGRPANPTPTSLTWGHTH